MEKMKIGKNGVSNINRLPPGFRFQPTDEELVFQYLKCKVFSSHLPASMIIPHINVCNYDPWDFPGICDGEDRYCFSRKEAKYQRGNRMNRTTKSGYWKATGSDRKILPPISSNSNSNIIIGILGIRKTLVFYEGKSPNGSRTDWLMHEYRLLTDSNSSQSYGNEIGDWILCRIFNKKRSIDSNTAYHHHMLNNNNITVMKNNNVIIDVAKPRFFDFMRVHNSASSAQPIIHDSSLSLSSSSSSSITCSSSSYITEVSSLNKEETRSDGYGDL